MYLCESHCETCYLTSQTHNQKCWAQSLLSLASDLKNCFPSCFFHLLGSSFFWYTLRASSAVEMECETATRGSDTTPPTRDVKHIAVISLKCLRSLQEMVKLLAYDNTHFIFFLFRLWVYLPPFSRKLLSLFWRSFEDVKEFVGTHTDVPKMEEIFFRCLDMYLTKTQGNHIRSLIKIYDLNKSAVKFECDKKQVISVLKILSLSTKFHEIIGLVT